MSVLALPRDVHSEKVGNRPTLLCVYVCLGYTGADLARIISSRHRAILIYMCIALYKFNDLGTTYVELEFVKRATILCTHGDYRYIVCQSGICSKSLTAAVTVIRLLGATIGRRYIERN